ESIEAALMPGSYYILISTFPSPNCIPSFDLAITVDNNVCIAPINLAVVDLWQDEVTIEWEAGFLETSFNVLYGEAGFDPDTEGTLISGVTSPYTISDLISETEYDVYVQADCDSDWASITFTTLAACPAPIELYATNITSESAELGWNAVGGTDTWNVEYGVAGFTQGEGTLISATNDNPVFVDGLTPATTYEFYVQADCGAEQSIWVGPYAFFTECADAVLPIYQDFEDDSYLCWTAISNNEVNGPGGSGYYPMGIYFEDETETNKVLLFSSYSSATDYNQYLITPELPANAGLDISFDYAQGSSYSSGEVFRVGYSTTTSDLAEFTWGDEIVTVDTDIHEYIDVLPANTKFVAINYYSDYQYYLAVDNISISEIQLEDPTIAEIDVYTEVEDANVCLGALESEALDQLVDEITISDSDGGEHVVTVSWTIDSYNGDVADTYTATGTFELPTGVVQTDPETTLEVYADVVVNELPVVTCPDDFTVTTLDPVEISGESPQGGVYAGTGVTNGIFDPNGLENDNYVITYTYQDPTTGCENECEFTITLNYVGIETSSLAEISIYPNPNKGVFVMDLSNIEGKVYYQIYDTKGSVIISNEFVNYGGVEEFNLDVAPGIYYIQLRNAEQTINKKIVVH
ncbi:MAG: choice-of-anchor J domain-containing protein, partial [Bacteroidales bacterium]|nr:choice-of-anchor J domain-containing protein [Bacteroidales bacterium]